MLQSPSNLLFKHASAGPTAAPALVLSGRAARLQPVELQCQVCALLCVLEWLDRLQDATRQQHLIQERQAQLPSDTSDLPAAQQQCTSARQEALRLAEGRQAADAALHEAQQQRTAAVQATQGALDQVSRALVFMQGPDGPSVPIPGSRC